MKIVLGTTSKHKIGAVEVACARLGISAEVSGIRAPSGENEQPVGILETSRGARARAIHVQGENDGVVAIGIESGIMYELGCDVVIDLAVVVVLHPEKGEIITTSTGVRFPMQFVTEAEMASFDNTTVGSRISKALGGDGTDPHSTLTNGKVTRTQTLIDGLVAALSQF